MVMQAVTQGPNVKWVRQARWVNDGNIWTSSGVSAGMDMIYAFIAAQYGEDVSAQLAQMSEYVPNKDSSNDPFAKLYT
jgi:transcriptional regulator GlxA family with amidase domain